MISRTTGLLSMSMTFLSSSAVHLNPFCISIYQYIQVCTGTHVYIWVCTGTYWYVLVCTCVQKRSCRARAHLGWTFSASWHWAFASGTGSRARSTLDHRNIPFWRSWKHSLIAVQSHCKPRKPISQWFQNLLYDIHVCTNYVPVWTSMYGYLQVCTGMC